MRDFDPTASEFITSGFISNSKPSGRLYDPTTIAVAGVGSSLLNGAMQSDAASTAASAQGDAARASDATQRYFYDTTRADNAGFRQTGNAANNRLAYLMGLSGGGMSGQGAPQQMGGASAPTTRTGQPGDPIWDEIMADFQAQHTAQFGQPFSRSWDSDSDSRAAKARLDAQYQTAVAADPTYQAAQASQASANAADPAFGSLSRNYSAADLANDPVTNAAPGYMQPMHQFGQADLSNDLVYQNGLQFGLDEGAKGINRMASASGGSLSGATLKALTRFGNDYGTTKTAGAYDRFTNNQNTQYGQRVDSFNRFNNTQDRTYNKLAGLSGAGMQATNQVSAAGQNAGKNISASQQGLGNAQGAAAIAQGNSWQNALNSGAAAIRGSGYTNPGNSQSSNFFNGTGAWRGTDPQSTNFFDGTGPWSS